METSKSSEHLLEAVINSIKEELEGTAVCQDLTLSWTELWDDKEQKKRTDILSMECAKSVVEMIQSVLEKETQSRQNYIERVEKLLNEMKELQENLGIAIPYEDVQSLPLHNMAYHLNKKAEKYRQIKDERMNKMNDLRQREAVLCDMLGMIQNQINCSVIPTEAELEQLENQVDSMKREKDDRMLTFLEKRKSICSLFEELGVKPRLPFEKEVVNEESMEQFKVNNENMALLEDLEKGLVVQMEDAKQTVSELKDKLRLMWSYLDEPESHADDFLNLHPGLDVSTITALKQELRRCEEIKKQNIAKILERIRKILVEEWDRCLISEEERDRFRPFRIDCYTEDLCDLHELEIERLRGYYEANEQIFTLYSKHQKLFHKLLELENRGKNAKRYYNRGGQLLQEERERKAITKDLPNVEDELRVLLAQFEMNAGKPFLSFGVPLTTKIDDQWAAHFDQKTIDKMARKNASDMKKKTPLGKRGNPTPNTGIANKVSRLNVETKSGGSTLKTPKVTPRRFVTVRKKITYPSTNEPDLTFTKEPTYDEFQNDLQLKVGGSRSTAVAPAPPIVTRVLRERNTPPLDQLTPKWISTAKTPLTFPRSTRRKSVLLRTPSTPHLTPARNRLPIII